MERQVTAMQTSRNEQPSRKGLSTVTIAKVATVSVVATVVALTLSACGKQSPEATPGGADASELEKSTSGVTELEVVVLETLPHDEDAFTQGLELHDGLLYESTGLVGQSQARIVDPSTGDIVEQVDLPDDVFGEGLTVADDVVWQLTWQDGVAYKRDRESLAELAAVEYDGDGWGICSMDDGSLVMSDGGAQLAIRDGDSFEVNSYVEVNIGGQQVHKLNELECDGDTVWANIWQDNFIVGIDIATGDVHTVVDASALAGEWSDTRDKVLNGIAAVGDGTFYLTGKQWPHLFHVEFQPAS